MFVSPYCALKIEIWIFFQNEAGLSSFENPENNYVWKKMDAFMGSIIFLNHVFLPNEQIKLESWWILVNVRSYIINCRWLSYQYFDVVYFRFDRFLFSSYLSSCGYLMDYLKELTGVIGLDLGIMGWGYYHLKLWFPWIPVRWFFGFIIILYVVEWSVWRGYTFNH